MLSSLNAPLLNHCSAESDLVKSRKVTKSVTKSEDKSIEERILEFCQIPRSAAEIAEYIGFQHRSIMGSSIWCKWDWGTSVQTFFKEAIAEVCPLCRV